MKCNRNNFSNVVLFVCAGFGISLLAWMTLNKKFTFTLIGLTFIIIYSILSDTGRNCMFTYGNTANTNNADITDNQNVAKTDVSVLKLISQFSVEVLSTSLFTTDLFFAYQIFDYDLNYIPLLGGLLNIFTGIYLGTSKRNREILIFTIPANCWGQVYIAGFKHQNIYSMCAGYIFFAAYYYIEVDRINFTLLPYAQFNYLLSVYCVFATFALYTAFFNNDRGNV